MRTTSGKRIWTRIFERLNRLVSFKRDLSATTGETDSEREVAEVTTAEVTPAKNDGERTERKVGELALFPPRSRWNDWQEWDPKAWPRKVAKNYTIVPTVCFNCESACGLIAYVDKDTREIRKFEGNPEHPGSRGRNCAKGPATINQVEDTERILKPLKRKGARGSGQWEETTWDEVLDVLSTRIRKAIEEDRRKEIMYHVGRPGEDVYTERVLAAWGIDGHNSHTNICSSGARAGYAFWMGIDRPSPDYANAKFIMLISAHLESGHYFNPHAQRIMEAKMSGARVAVLDPRLSNTASHADYWLPTYPGSEPIFLLAIANELIRSRRINEPFIREWVNWQDYMRHIEKSDSEVEPEFSAFLDALEKLYEEYTPEYSEKMTGVPAKRVKEIADEIARAGTAFATHTWRASSAGNLGGWQTARCLFFLNVLTGSVATPGGTAPNSWNKFVPKPFTMPAHPEHWNELTWPKEFPLAFFEMSFLLPHLLKAGNGKVDTYFTRVYNPVWTNPDGMSWMEVLCDEEKVGLHCALTPTWSETAWFADYVLPMGLGPERHDLHSYETQAGTWIGFRQPVLRVAAQRLGDKDATTLGTNPGEVWEENQFWIDLSWKIDPDGELGIRKHFESPYRPGEKISIDEYYRWIFENSVPGLPEAAKEEGTDPLDFMRNTGAFEVEHSVYKFYDQQLTEEELQGAKIDVSGRIYQNKESIKKVNIVPLPQPSDADGRVLIGIMNGEFAQRGFPTPSGKLEFFSPTLMDWGWEDLAVPTYIESHVSKKEVEDIDFGQEGGTGRKLCLLPTFRLPVHIHTRSGNAKWLSEIAHSNPLWINPVEAARLKVKTGELVRVETEIGYFVLKAWVTESIAPGVVACSHHMGRWRLEQNQGNERWSSAVVDLTKQADSKYLMRQKAGVSPFDSTDEDSKRIWWNDAGVHQNLTFPVQPDPISGMHCWHQRVRVSPAKQDDRYGDIFVDTEKSHKVFQRWLKKTKPAPGPDGMRRPWWLLRPLRPSRDAYKFSED